MEPGTSIATRIKWIKHLERVPKIVVGNKIDGERDQKNGEEWGFGGLFTNGRECQGEELKTME